jgi:hypothetical protein
MTYDGGYMNKLALALVLVLLGALPAFAQQRPLFDPQTGAINPNGALGNQPARPGAPAMPSGPYGGRQWVAPAQRNVPPPFQQPSSGSPASPSPPPNPAPGACVFNCPRLAE